ncbi:MAG: hypothetical protein OXN25_10525 [Candidatus Poribacteria bacterium]|nr:hypothetical protein [Candidatus Poribacteria bacterium]MYK19919.1 hypothetical protein [Candidatus Poribacteria bacterium]
MKKKKAVVLWTGGKDSALAFQVSLNLYDIRRLVCFVPADNRQFYAHPTQLMELQARKIGIPIEFMPISEPYASSYRQQIEKIRDSDIEVLITGDISTVGGMPNWIDGVAAGVAGVYKPLWELEREAILDELVSKEFKVICSLAYKKYFQSTIAGRYLDLELISELKQLPIDPCGEQGEYHTWVLDAPFFRESIRLEGTQVVEAVEYYYLTYEKAI